MSETISEGQAKRLWAMAYTWARENGLSKDDVHDRVIAVCKQHNAEDPSELTRDAYTAACAEFEEG